MIRVHRPTCPDPVSLIGKKTYKSSANKAALLSATYSKCMYCETKITHQQFGDVEHIKPKDLFPGDQFNWQNLGIACVRCNNAKSNKYDPMHPYIDPFSEDPADHLIPLGNFVMGRSDSIRGRTTVADLGLNRAQLLERRSEHLQKLRMLAEAIADAPNPSLAHKAKRFLQEHVSEESEFSFVGKAVVQDVL